MWEDKEIDKVVKGFLRQILGVNKKTTISGLRAETGKYPLSMNIYTQMMKYWTRLLTTESQLMQEAHKDNLKRFREGKPCWIQPLIYLLRTCEIEEIDVSKVCENRHLFIRQIKEKLSNHYKTNWKESIERKDGKLRFYQEMKKNFQFENYLDKISRADRKQITRLRLSCHNLPIETMRYQKTETRKEERKCNLCSGGEVGDEWHYLTSCKHIEISDVRGVFEAKVKSLQPQLRNFNLKSLMKYCITMHDTLVQGETALFVKELLQTYGDATEKEEGKCSLM